MKPFLLIALLLADTGATASPAGSSTVPLHLYQGKQFTIDAVVAGKRRTFLFDTGEGVTMISPALAAETGCQPWGNVAAFRMLGERLDLKHCDNIRFIIGAGSYLAPTTIVYDLADVVGTGTKLDGAIGLDLFAGKLITLRFGAGEVVVEAGAEARTPQQRGIEVPIRLSRPAEGAALDADIGVRTPKGIAWMELDSGNAGPTIFVSPAIAPLFGLRTDTKQSQDVTASMAPCVTFHGKARVFPGMIMDGNIGLQFMRDWDITFDLPNGRAWLRKTNGT
jgi:hypothetical protein